MVEFTGERVVPGEVDRDLWNEHVARYAFAARLAGRRRVLDAGCGTGYGSAELARTALAVTGVDTSAEAVRYARERYPLGNLSFVQGSCSALPLAESSVDLVVAYEVIEHVADWQGFLAEARRVLGPAGLLAISTPNKLYYAESRRRTGPNPFHVHEFEFEEFAGELGRRFPHVALYLENHVEGIGFQRRGAAGLELGVAAEAPEPAPAEAHFFLAVCGEEPVELPGFLYVPSAANVLRERERHIERLEGELGVKDGWLEELRLEKQNLVEMFREQTAELERSNAWARQTLETLHAAQARIVELQREIDETTAGYQAQLSRVEEDHRKSVEWALSLQAQLESKGKELVECVRLLDAAEKTVEERSAWALRLEAQARELETLLSQVRASRWVKLGRTVGLGPELAKK